MRLARHGTEKTQVLPIFRETCLYGVGIAILSRYQFGRDRDSRICTGAVWMGMGLLFFYGTTVSFPIRAWAQVDSVSSDYVAVQLS